MHHFFAYLSRLKHINRWNLMRNVRQENVMEHTCEVAMIAHGLTLIQNARYGGALDPQRAAVLALYHEAGEVITGDLVTPVKYYNPQITGAFKQIEALAQEKVCDMLPEDLAGAYRGIILNGETEPEWPYVKAADRICAYLKCVEELKGGNSEFQKAAQSILRSIQALKLEAVGDFMAEFAPSYALALDELNEP
jgi:5'-deoxynucleotidase